MYIFFISDKIFAAAGEIGASVSMIAQMSTWEDKLKKYRQSGLDGDGELSYENLVFKYLRRSEHIEKLFDSINKGTDKELSVERKMED